MPCMTKTFECRIHKVYVGAGNPYYHGELCGDCMFWQDNPDDLEFKTRAKSIFGDIYIKSRDNSEAPEWF